MTTIREHLKALMTLGRGTIEGMKDPRGDENPIDLFRGWFDTAQECGLFMPEAMTLATATADGRPSARMVLLKGVDDRGFEFFTNYGSRKAAEMDANPHAALILHWAVLERQIRVEGTVSRMTDEESFAYFRTRPRGSRIGAWASQQSQPLTGRGDLEARVKEYGERFPDDVPLPPFWGGYRLDPQRIEFWQGKADRLHERLVFTREGDGWGTDRLYP